MEHIRFTHHEPSCRKTDQSLFYPQEQCKSIIYYLNGEYIIITACECVMFTISGPDKFTLIDLIFKASDLRHVRVRKSEQLDNDFKKLRTRLLIEGSTCIQVHSVYGSATRYYGIVSEIPVLDAIKISLGPNRQNEYETTKKYLYECGYDDLIPEVESLNSLNKVYNLNGEIEICHVVEDMVKLINRKIKQSKSKVL